MPICARYKQVIAGMILVAYGRHFMSCSCLIFQRVAVLNKSQRPSIVLDVWFLVVCNFLQVSTTVVSFVLMCSASGDASNAVATGSTSDQIAAAMEKKNADSSHGGLGCRSRMKIDVES